MTPPLRKQSWQGRRVMVAAVNPSQQARRIRDAVARRAFHIFESRQSSAPGHQLEDWQRAESEVVRPLGCGILTLDNKISLNTDISVFEEGLIEVCPEPRRLVICGKVRALNAGGPARNGPDSQEEGTFHIVDLPVEIDPSQATLKFNGPIVQIDLAKTAQDAVLRANAT